MDLDRRRLAPLVWLGMGWLGMGWPLRLGMGWPRRLGWLP